MKTEELVSEIGKSFLTPLAWLKLIFLLCILATPFTLIWVDWSITWRVGLTGLFGVIIVGYISKGVKQSLKEQIEKVMKEDEEINGVMKSKFMKSLEKAVEESQNKKKEI